MTRRHVIVAVTGLITLATFATAAFPYQRYEFSQLAQQCSVQPGSMVRPHSPVLGRADVSVTIGPGLRGLPGLLPLR